MMFQRAKQKYISCHLSLFNVNNVSGFVACQGYVCMQWVFKWSVTICKVASIKLKLSSIKLNWSSIELNWSSIKLKLSSIEL